MHASAAKMLSTRGLLRSASLRPACGRATPSFGEWFEDWVEIQRLLPAEQTESSLGRQIDSSTWCEGIQLDAVEPRGGEGILTVEFPDRCIGPKADERRGVVERISAVACDGGSVM